MDIRGDKTEGWSIGEMRGNKQYYPPLGWIGIGLNVMDKYENNIWICKDNRKGEWCVAYHGVGRNKESEGTILENFQEHESHDDIFHPGNKLGKGVCVTPKIEVEKRDACILEFNGKKYKIVLMVRVKPSAIRQCKCTKDKDDYWVVNGTPNEIRPYRILYKKVNFLFCL